MATDYGDIPPPIPLKGPLLLHEITLPSTLLVIALCIPHQSWLITSIFLPAILAAHYRLLQTTSSNPSFGYFVGTYVAMHTLITLNLLVFSNPRRDFRRLIPAYCATTNGVANGTKEKAFKEPIQKGEGYPQDSLLRRLGWVIELTQVSRGIGWNWQIRPIPSTDPRELTSVRVFFRRRIVRLSMILLWLDFLCWLMRDLDGAYFLPEGNAFHNPDTYIPLYRSLWSKPWKKQEFPPPKGFPAIPQGEDKWLARGAYILFLRTMRAIFSASAMYSTINAPYTIKSVIAASMGCIFGLGEPGGWRSRWLDWRSWPDIFGGWRQGDWGHGILGWWGTAWHSIFKNVCNLPLLNLFCSQQLIIGLQSFTAPGRFIISNLSLRKNGPAATAVNFITPFLMSGALHFAGSYSQSGGGWGCVRFFLLQPFGIASERTFLYVYRRFAPSSLRSKVLEKYVPYLWTVAWFTIVSPSFFDEYRYGGVWSVEPIPLSVFRGMSGNGWWHWGPSNDGRVWWMWHDSLGGWGIQL